MWVYSNDNSNFTIFFNKPDLPNLIEIHSLPEGEGTLRRAENGTFYYEPFPKPIEPIEPETPEVTQEEIQLQTLLNTEFLVIMSEINGQ